MSHIPVDLSESCPGLAVGLKLAAEKFALGMQAMSIREISISFSDGSKINVYLGKSEFSVEFEKSA